MYIVTVFGDNELRRYGYSNREQAIAKAHEFAASKPFKVIVSSFAEMVRDENAINHTVVEVAR